MKKYLLPITFILFLFWKNTLTAQPTGIKTNTHTMLTYEQALKKAQAKLNEISENDSSYVIWEERTIVKEYGWVFVPATKEYIRTKDPMSLVPGINPIFVAKDDSACEVIPSSITSELFLKDFEEKLSKRKKD